MSIIGWLSKPKHKIHLLIVHIIWLSYSKRKEKKRKQSPTINPTLKQQNPRSQTRKTDV